MSLGDVDDAALSSLCTCRLLVEDPAVNTWVDADDAAFSSYVDSTLIVFEGTTYGPTDVDDAAFTVVSAARVEVSGNNTTPGGGEPPPPSGGGPTPPQSISAKTNIPSRWRSLTLSRIFRGL